MQLDTVKNYLDVTWTDTATDAKLAGILSRAESTLSSYAGVELDFADETTPEAQLLLDLCRYIWWERFEEFKINYQSELLMLRANAAAADGESGEDDESTDEENGQP
jgi:hypothetical protein